MENLKSPMDLHQYQTVSFKARQRPTHPVDSMSNSGLKPRDMSNNASSLSKKAAMPHLHLFDKNLKSQKELFGGNSILTNISTQIEGEGHSVLLNSQSTAHNLIAKTTDDLIGDMSVIDGVSGSQATMGGVPGGISQIQIPRAGSMLDTRIQQSLKKKQMQQFRKMYNISLSSAQQKDTTQNTSSFQLTSQRNNDSAEHLLAPEIQNKSVAVLPVIGTEVSVERSAAQLNRRLDNKIELSRKDLQNFIACGSVSKSFIKSNQRELRQFIKVQGRQKRLGSSSDLMRGYEQANFETEKEKMQRTGQTLPGFGATTSKDKNSALNPFPKAAQRAQSKVEGTNSPSLSHMQLSNQKDPQKRVKMQNLLSKTQTTDILEENGGIGEYLQKDMIILNDHQRVDKGFKGEISHNVSTRVIETWINETLTDAQHLDIPGIVVKPDHKNPINRYGIDRLNLVNLGLSNEDCNRIYRSLFVYSVGFFELLRKILQKSHKNYSIITSVWKVFQILLEYCCKTDYRIFLAEITQKHQKEIKDLELKFKHEIQEYIDNDRVLKQNMETLREFNDTLEKEKATEKDLRLKLEEEYMQNTKNHEDEVKLRLKFEGKFNKMHAEHRELEIKHNRTVQELKSAIEAKEKGELQINENSEELISLKNLRAEHESKIASLAEFKQQAERQIRRNGSKIQNAEKSALSANEQTQLHQYKVLENDKKMIDIQTQLSQKNSSVLHLQNVIEEMKTKLNEISESESMFKSKYEESNEVNSKLIARQDAIEAELALNVTQNKEFRKELDGLRNSNKRLKDKNDQLVTEWTSASQERNKLKGDMEQLDLECKSLSKQLQEVNEDRHKQINDLEQARQKIVDLEKSVAFRLDQIENLKTEIANKQTVIDNLQKELATETDNAFKERTNLKKQIRALEKEVNDKDFKGTLANDKIQALTKECESFKISLNKKNYQIERLEKAVTVGEETAQSLQDSLYVQKQKFRLKDIMYNKANKARNEAFEELREAVEIAKTLEETLRKVTILRKKEESHYRGIIDKMASTNESILMKKAESETISANLTEKLQTVEKQYAEYKSEGEKIKEEFKKHKVLADREHKRVLGMVKEIALLQKDMKEQEEKFTQDSKNLQEDTNGKINDLEQNLSKERAQAAAYRNKAMKESKLMKDNNAKLKKQVQRLEVSENKFKALAHKRGKDNEDMAETKGRLTGVKMVDKFCQTRPMKMMMRNKVKAMASKSNEDLTSQTQSNDNIQPKDQETPSKINQLSDKKTEAKSEIEIRENQNQAQQVEEEQKKAKEQGSSLSPSQKAGHQKSKSMSPNKDQKRRDSVLHSIAEKADQTNRATSQPSSLAHKDSQNTQQSQQPTKRVDPEKIKLQRKKELKEWFVEVEKQVLEKIEAKVLAGEQVSEQMVQQFRKEHRMPIQLQKVQLEAEEMVELEGQQTNMVKYMQERAIKKLQYGEAYSSDYTERELSEYVTDSEAGDNLPLQQEIQVTKIEENLNVDKVELEVSGQLNQAINQSAKMRISDDEQVRMSSAIKQIDSIGTSVNLTDSTPNNNKPRLSTQDLMADMLRKNTMRSREERIEEIHKELLEEKSKTLKKTQNLHPGKKRVVKKSRVLKERKDDYEKERARILAELQMNFTEEEKQAIAARAKKYSSLFSNFAQNYSKTLEIIAEESKKFFQNKAQDRQIMHQNEDVDNIQGREPLHFLIKEQKDVPYYKYHMDLFEKGLKDSTQNFATKDQQEAERLQKEKEEQARLQAEEKRKSQERRDRIVIVREDLIAEQEKQAAQMQQLEQLQPILANQAILAHSDEGSPRRVSVLNSGQNVQESPSMENLRTRTNQQDALDQHSLLQKSQSTEFQIKRDTEMQLLDARFDDQFSQQLEGQGKHEATSIVPENNPQNVQAPLVNTDGQLVLTEEEKFELLKSLQSQKALSGGQPRVDQSLQEITRGGVAAVHREIHLRKSMADNQAVVGQQAPIGLNPMGSKSQSVSKAKKPINSIKSLIRAADSRP